MSKSFSKTLLAAALFGCALTAAAPAHAVEDKVFPASFCVRWAGPATEALGASGLRNTSPTSSIDIDCPIVKDQPTTGILNATVRVVDRHPTQNVTCHLCNYRYVGSTVLGGCVTRTSAGSGSFIQGLNFPTQTGAGSISQNWYFSCSIPPAASGQFSEVFNYYVNEQ